MNDKNIQSNEYKGLFALAGSALIYSIFGILIRWMEPMYGVYSQVMFRFFLAFLILSIFLFFWKNKNTLTNREKIFSMLSGISFGLLVVMFTIAVLNVKLSDTIFIFYAGSIISSFVIGTLFYREEVNAKKWLMIVTAVLGLFVYVDFSIAISFGILMAIFSGVLDGVTNAIRKLLKDANKYEVMKIQFFWSSLVALIGVFVFNEEPILKEVSAFPLIITLIFALLQIKLADLLLYGFSHYNVSIGSIILASEVFLTSLWGYLFFSEKLAVHEWVGGILIFLASIVGVINFKKYFTEGK